MTKEEITALANVEENVKRRIDFLASEMRDDRNDGWVKQHYKNTLKQVRDHINKALEE